MSFSAEWIRIAGTYLVANLRELLFLVGLTLTSVGASRIYPPLALLVPGLILLWLAIPPRAPRREK